MPSVHSLMFNNPLVPGFWPGCLAPDMKEVFATFSSSSAFHFTSGESPDNFCLTFSWRCRACATAPPPPSTSSTARASSSSSSSSRSTSATSDPLSLSCWIISSPTVRWEFKNPNECHPCWSRWWQSPRGHWLASRPSSRHPGMIDVAVDSQALCILWRSEGGGKGLALTLVEDR